MRHWLGLTLILALIFVSAAPRAQSLRVRSSIPKMTVFPVHPWSGYLRYSAATDYARSEQPRAYVQVLGGGGKYDINENWSVSGDVTLKMETYDGKIEKGPEETKLEVMNPSAAMELDYARKFYDTHSYTLFVHGEPLMDEPSRLEGYRGLVGTGGELSLGFFKRRYVLSQVLDISELINTYDYNLDQEPNPDMFYTYKMSHVFRLWRTVKFTASFGLKLTRYLNASTTYNYNNTFILSHTWKSINMALAYDNGGFTDDGTVRLWYLDEYRRVFQLMLNYSF